MIILDYVKGKENKGALMINDSYNPPIYTGVTMVSSKDFKTIKGAEKYMGKFGYKKVV